MSTARKPLLKRCGLDVRNALRTLQRRRCSTMRWASSRRSSTAVGATRDCHIGGHLPTQIGKSRLTMCPGRGTRQRRANFVPMPIGRFPCRSRQGPLLPRLRAHPARSGTRASPSPGVSQPSALRLCRRVMPLPPSRPSAGEAPLSLSRPHEAPAVAASNQERKRP
jgi:hypothetical protein